MKISLEYDVCDRCGGSGKVKIKPGNPDAWDQQCGRCDGSGGNGSLVGISINNDELREFLESTSFAVNADVRGNVGGVNYPL